MEIEAKYRVTDRHIFAELLHMSGLGDFSLIPDSALEHQHNTYYDTSDNRIAARGMSLRIRRVGTSYRATLKRSRGSVGAIHMRDELEAIVGAEPQPIFWKPSEVRERVLQIIGPSTLIALFTIQNRRQHIDVIRDGAMTAEISLDEGSIQAGGRILGFRELEVELHHSGATSELEQIITQLMERFALFPEPYGKRTRGIMLLRALAASREEFHSPPSLQERTVGTALVTKV